MKNQNIVLKIGFSCVIGGALGALIGLRVIHSLWWIGPIIGMLAGYLSYEFKTVIKAIPQAWETARSHKIDPYRFKWTFLSLYIFLLFALPYILLLIFIIESVIPYCHSYNNGLLVYFGILSFLVSIIGSVVGLVIFSGMFIASWWLPNSKKDWQTESKDFVKLIKYYNIVSIPFTALYYVLKWLYKVRTKIIPTTKAIFSVLGEFFKALFLLIHSQARLICGVDSLLGALIGYYFESPMIGGLAGMVLGIVNYYVVSIRILKLEPKL